MTINTQTGISDVMLGDGANLVFPFGFKIATASEIEVYVDGQLIDETAYTVALSLDWTGSVTFDTAPVDAAEVVLVSAPAFVQSSEHLRQGPFFPDVVEDDLDKAALRDIAIKRDVDRAFKLPLLSPIDQAGKFPVVLPDGSQGWSAGTGADAGLRADVAASSGAALIGSDDSASGTLWTTIAGFITYLRSSVGSSILGFLQSGTGAVARTAQAKMRDVVSVKDFGAVWDNVADDTAAIQAAIDSTSGPLEVRLPAGTGKITGTIYLRRDGVRLVGCGTAVTQVRYSNAAGGIAFSGDTNTTSSKNEYADCGLLDFTVVRSDNNFTVSADNDPSIVVDLTSFSYSHFNIGAQVTRANACIYYGQGNAGTAPYFNHIETSSGWFGGSDNSQTAIRFRGGAWTGGSSGPNANHIGPVTRAAGLSIVADIGVGQGNMFSSIGAESIKDAYIRLGGNAAVQTGTSTGSNGAITLKDTGKSWATNAYVGGAVKITGGTGSGQVRRIASNNATELKLPSAWATIPDTTSTYEVFESRCADNKFVNVRQEGSSSSIFIDAYPDSTNNEVVQTSIQSTGGYLNDSSCSPLNKFFGQSRVLLYYSFVNPGASADINGWARSSVFGGVKMAGQYVVDWVAVDCTSASHGDTATVRVDCGGTAAGNGDPTFVISIPAAESTGMAFPVGSRVQQDGLNKSLFLNLQTGASFSAGVSVNVTVAVTLLGA